jgi:hypothetical protein
MALQRLTDIASWIRSRTTPVKPESAKSLEPSGGAAVEGAATAAAAGQARTDGISGQRSADEYNTKSTPREPIGFALEADPAGEVACEIEPGSAAEQIPAPPNPDAGGLDEG